MNTAIYELGDYDTDNDVVVWTDITNYVLSSGDFNIIFNNYDGTIKETEFNLVINDEYDIPYGVKDRPLRIKQDGKVLFYGYVHALIDRKVNDSETDFVIRSVLDRLNRPVTWFGDYTYIIQNYTANAVGFTTYVKSIPVGDLLELIFLKPGGWGSSQVPIGVVKVQVDAEALNLYCPEILHEPLYSGGSDVVGFFQNRYLKDLNSWKDIIERICYMGFILIWDIDNERFKFIYTGAKDDGVNQTIYTSPVDAKIYKVEKETLDMIRTMTITSKWCSDWSKYITFTTTGELNRESQSTLTVTASAESLDLGEFKSVLFVNSDRSDLVHGTPKSYWNRFSLILDFFTLTTDILTDVAGAETDYTCLFNVSSYDAKLIDGRYFGELQLFDVSTESSYDNRDSLEKEFESQISERSI